MAPREETTKFIWGRAPVRQRSCDPGSGRSQPIVVNVSHSHSHVACLSRDAAQAQQQECNQVGQQAGPLYCNSPACRRQHAPGLCCTRMLQPSKQSVARGGLDWVIGPLDAHKQRVCTCVVSSIEQAAPGRFVNTGQISFLKNTGQIRLSFCFISKIDYRFEYK
jgi:hypothetical protein